MEYKTNVMRILDKNHINYNTYSYDQTNAISGMEVALVLKQNPKQVFKTLVTISKSNKNYVFMIPVDMELDLKKAAKVTNEKSIEMIKSKDLLSLTGYIHGGCSPIGMKKNFPTFINETAKDFSTIIFSAGKIGFQIDLSLSELGKIVNYRLEDIVVK